ncbi:Fe-Mn family superoxide dismutase [Candidatus Wolfebacteria bacterium]|nr:Fe-Mn family superoxide dismutase [Candidatus Wolfebacteria bacterium]
MHHYETKKFVLPSLKGISEKQITEHLKLYEGYVKHVNKISEQVKEWLAEDEEKYSYPISELWRRLSFEFNGMRSHEYYFNALEGGAAAFDPESPLGKALVAQYGSYENWAKVFTRVAKTRGSGWTMLYYDRHSDDKPFIVGWIDEHHIGYLSSLPLVLALDCWEHAYMVDYTPGERGKYISAYLNNINWEVVEQNFQNAQS